jgi:hypothetical protein
MEGDREVEIRKHKRQAMVRELNLKIIKKAQEE